MSASLELSIVIVNWKVRDLLRDCLRSVHDQMQMPRGDWEIVVVDNDSQDGSVEMVRREFPEVTLVVNAENRGFAVANNQALPLCRGRTVLLLNPDTVVLDHAIDRLAEYLRLHAEIGAVGCRLQNTDGSFQRWTGGAFPSLWNTACHYWFLSRVLPSAWRPTGLFLDRDVPEDRDVEWLSGACLALRRSALGDRIFDESRFLYGEDMELCDRLRRAGYRVVYTPSVTVTHHQGQSLNQQSNRMLLHALRGPRSYYTLQHGHAMVWLYDGITVTGFFLRWVAFQALAVGRGGRGYGARAASSRRYMMRAFQVMLGRG